MPPLKRGGHDGYSAPPPRHSGRPPDVCSLVGCWLLVVGCRLSVVVVPVPVPVQLQLQLQFLLQLQLPCSKLANIDFRCMR